MTPDELVVDYLTSLRRELTGLPRSRRRELIQEIEEHIAEGREELLFDDEVGVRTLLDRLGDPAEIAAAARGSDPPPREWRVRDVATILLLPFGGLVIPVVGWLAGAALLWTSAAWTTRDKLLGTLIVPGGLLTAGYYFGAVVFDIESGCTSTQMGDGPVHTSCPPGSETDLGGILQSALFVFLVLAPLVMTVYLARRRRPVGSSGTATAR